MWANSKRECRFLISAMCMALLLGILSPGIVFAASLWSDAAQTSVLFGDQRARAVGDILTVVVNESSTATRTGSSTNSKSASNNVEKGTGLLGFVPDSTTAQDDSFKAQGTINNSNKVTARLTVKVIEVKPNGNLVISGVQNIRQNGEEQRINISGQVRPSDIRADNSVLSSNIADAKLLVTGSGPLVNKQRQGILTQIWNWFF